jgi:hypothetical protein
MHIEIEIQLEQRNFMTMRCSAADRQRQLVTIHNCEDVHVFTMLDWSDLPPRRPGALGRGKCFINTTSRFIQRALFAQQVGKIGE